MSEFEESASLFLKHWLLRMATFLVCCPAITLLAVATGSVGCLLLSRIFPSLIDQHAFYLWLAVPTHAIGLSVGGAIVAAVLAFLVPRRAANYSTFVLPAVLINSFVVAELIVTMLVGFQVWN